MSSERPSRREPTEHAGQPDGEVLLHGYQGGLVSHGQPLVILEDIGKARAVSLRQGAAGASG